MTYKYNQECHDDAFLEIFFYARLIFNVRHGKHSRLFSSVIDRQPIDLSILGVARDLNRSCVHRNLIKPETFH